MNDQLLPAMEQQLRTTVQQQVDQMLESMGGQEMEVEMCIRDSYSPADGRMPLCPAVPGRLDGHIRVGTALQSPLEGRLDSEAQHRGR